VNVTGVEIYHLFNVIRGAICGVSMIGGSSVAVNTGEKVISTHFPSRATKEVVHVIIIAVAAVT
jgi:hypothetical protein